MDSESRRLISKGIVSSVYPEKHTCRVTFPDKDDMVSGELPVLVGFCKDNSIYRLPDVGESVVCVFETEDDTSGTGYVLGAMYDEKVHPKVNSIDKTRIDFRDGSFIEFDRSNSELRIEIKGNIVINGKAIYLN